MKKILIFVAIAFFTSTISAQEVKAVAKTKKESCCAKKNSKAMTAAEVETCKTKCKAEGKKCSATMAKASGKKC